MPETWKAACWRAEQELVEYRDVIVPAMMDRLREQEGQIGAMVKTNLDLANRLAEARCELRMTRQFVHEHGLEWALAKRLAGTEDEPPF